MPNVSRISFLVVTVAAGALGAALVIAPFVRAYGPPSGAAACPSAATDATASAILPSTR